MPTSDPLKVLLAHDDWATRQILIACSALTSEQFHQPFEMGPGSLHNTTTHLVSAMRRWTDALVSREPHPRMEEDGIRRTPTELLRLHEEIANEFHTIAMAHPVDEIVSAARGGKTYALTRGGILTHVTTHGMHHRAQCLNMLRHLGVTPLPLSSVLEWMRTVDFPQ